MKDGVVSIMMPAYNAERYIAQAIESVLAQSYTQWELVIVNDGSTDRTADIAAQYDDPRIRNTHQANAGEAAARNTALQHMQGEFVAFLDSDDFYLPDHLDLTVNFLKMNPSLSGVYSDGFYCNENGDRLAELSSRRRGPFIGRVFEEAVYSSDVFGPPVCVVLQGEIINHHDLKFDPNIIIGPDWDFFIQFSDLAEFGYLDNKTCCYRIHTRNLSSMISLEKRALELANCRMKAIKMASFQRCSLKTREWVFYDLLINQLRGYPERQDEITYWPEFSNLSEENQSRLYRLMASKAILEKSDPGLITIWLEKSILLNPRDWRPKFIAKTYGVKPELCCCLLQIKNRSNKDSRFIPPFVDLQTR